MYDDFFRYNNDMSKIIVDVLIILYTSVVLHLGLSPDVIPLWLTGSKHQLTN